MEQSDADFYHKMMPHDTDGKNRYKEKNNGKFHLFSSGWKNGENHLFPSHWKFGPYGQKNGGGINTIPPPRALRRAYAVSCRETKNPNPLPTANRFGFSYFGGDKRDRTADLLNAIQALSQLSYTPIYWRRGAVTLNASDIIPNGSAFVNHKFLIFQKNFAGPLHFPDSRGGAPRETAPWPEKEEADR